MELGSHSSPAHMTQAAESTQDWSPVLPGHRLHTHTQAQSRDSSRPTFHVIGLWEESGVSGCDTGQWSWSFWDIFRCCHDNWRRKWNVGSKGKPPVFMADLVNKGRYLGRITRDDLWDDNNVQCQRWRLRTCQYFRSAQLMFRKHFWGPPIFQCSWTKLIHTRFFFCILLVSFSWFVIKVRSQAS